MAYQLYVLEFPNGKKYFGVTGATLERRWSQHRRAYRYGARDQVNMAINKYDPEKVVARTLVIGEKAYILDLEIKVIAAFQTRDPKHGYNTALGGLCGMTTVPEIAARGGMTKRGRPLAPEHRAAISAAHMGKKLSEEHKASVSRTLTGRTQPACDVEARAAAIRGRPQSPETIEKRMVGKREAARRRKEESLACEKT